MKQLFMKQSLILASMALAASISPIANAGIQWDPKGDGSSTLDLGAFDWSQSSFTAKAGNTAIANWIATGGACGGVGGTLCDFQVYSHARLGSTTDSLSNSNTPTGLNGTFEYTMTMGFTEKVTSVAGTTATFAADPTKASFLEIYYDNSKDSSALTGYGFSDGELVMRGVLNSASTGLFFLIGTDTPPLDGFGANDYPGQTTRRGVGVNDNINFDVVAQNMAFFKEKVDSMGISYTNVSLALPFGQVDPSDCFNDTAKGALGTYTETECENLHRLDVLNPIAQPNALGGFVPFASPGNTTLTGRDANPDFVAQTDYNASLNGIPNVPEPSNLLMLGLGLLGMFRFASKRQRG